MSSVGSSRRGMRSVVTLPFAPRDAAPLRPVLTVRQCRQCQTHPLSASPSASRMMSLVLAVDHEREFRIWLDTGGSLGARSGSGAAGVVSCLR